MIYGDSGKGGGREGVQTWKECSVLSTVACMTTEGTNTHTKQRNMWLNDRAKGMHCLLGQDLFS